MPDSDQNQRLIQLYDELAIFNENCSFLCDAFTNIIADCEGLDTATVLGAERQAQWLKKRINSFKDELQKILD